MVMGEEEGMLKFNFNNLFVKQIIGYLNYIFFFELDV